MPIFFMLPFIIFQGMLEVAFDDVKEKPKETLLLEKSPHAVRTEDFTVFNEFR